MEATCLRWICGAVGLALALSATTKLRDRYAFLKVVLAWGVFSLRRGRVFAWVFPYIELTLGAVLSVSALLAPLRLVFVAPLAAVFATALALGHSVVYQRARGQPCGCGGGGRIGRASLAKASAFACVMLLASVLVTVS